MIYSQFGKGLDEPADPIITNRIKIKFQTFEAAASTCLSTKIHHPDRPRFVKLISLQSMDSMPANASANSSSLNISEGYMLT